VLKRDAGFTLVELLIVVLMIGILGAILVPKYAQQPEKARAAVAQADLKAIKAALEIYKVENPAMGFPAASAVKGVLGNYGINWTENSDGVRDPWAKSYRYYVSANADKFVVASTGSTWYVTETKGPLEGPYGTIVEGWTQLSNSHRADV